MCPGDGNDAGFDSFPTVTRTCVKGPPNDATRCWCLSALLELGADPALNAGSGFMRVAARATALADAKLLSDEARGLFEWGTASCGRRAACAGKSIRTRDITGPRGARRAALNRGRQGTVTRLDPRKGKYDGAQVEVDETAETETSMTETETEEGFLGPKPAIDEGG